MTLEHFKMNSRMREAAMRSACGRVAPVWPLDRFVAVNPYLGLLDDDFATAAETLRSVAGARMTLSGTDYESLYRAGRFTARDLDRAIAELDLKRTRAELLDDARSGRLDAEGPMVRTVADVIDAETDRAWSRLAADHAGAWAATYFDEGQAAWRPRREATLFQSWRADARVDRTFEVMGAWRFRRSVEELPGTALEASLAVIERLRIPDGGLESYLHRLLMRLGGWSAHAARIAWDRRLYDGVEDDTPLQLLAVLLAFEWGLWESLRDDRLEAAWSEARRDLASMAEVRAPDAALEGRLALQRAFDYAAQRELIATIDANADQAPPARTRRPAVQSIFCIDVRSERFRRHLEAADDGIETLGFAGFFGFPVAHVPLGHTDAAAQCPVLLSPTHRVHETIEEPADAEGALRRRVGGHEIKRAWNAFKMGAISCFSFVGPVGLAYLPKLFTDGWGWTRPVAAPETEGLGADASRRTIDLEARATDAGPVGIPHEERVELAAGALTGMSLTDGFARIVLVAGHGSTSVNNPHASGLDCGACGGQTGEANARVAAAVLNDPAVRKDLVARGIDIPNDTHFLAGLHDTTTDELTIFDRAKVPASHGADLAQLEQSLKVAGETCRTERARGFGSNDPDRLFARSRDWAQVRPEWGLAGCRAFIVAPRERTAKLDLEGRAFLHSYAWKSDEDFGVLELVMTAPMVVASWINLQYYASTVDNGLFGAGNKTLHNVVGTFGVVEGAAGDLRVGLPWQSVHDGTTLQHEPVRLEVVIEAPIDAMNAIIERHETVRHLVDNGWIQLFAMGDEGRVTHRYVGGLRWEAEQRGQQSIAA